MLNPSTADANIDDPTVTRCMDFAKRWGFDGISIVNLYAYRATDPCELWNVADPVGPENDAWIQRVVNRSEVVVAAWSSKAKRDRVERVLHLLGPREIKALKVNKDGSPSHPLYIPADTKLMIWKTPSATADRESREHRVPRNSSFARPKNDIEPANVVANQARNGALNDELFTETEKRIVGARWLSPSEDNLIRRSYDCLTRDISASWGRELSSFNCELIRNLHNAIALYYSQAVAEIKRRFPQLIGPSGVRPSIHVPLVTGLRFSSIGRHNFEDARVILDRNGNWFLLREGETKDQLLEAVIWETYADHGGRGDYFNELTMKVMEKSRNSSLMERNNSSDVLQIEMPEDPQLNRDMRIIADHLNDRICRTVQKWGAKASRASKLPVKTFAIELPGAPLPGIVRHDGVASGVFLQFTWDGTLDLHVHDVEFFTTFWNRALRNAHICIDRQEDVDWITAQLNQIFGVSERIAISEIEKW